MPRPTQGHVVERPWADGETVSYGAQVRAYGRYEVVTFGTNRQGWNGTRAELETERIMQQIERGTWVPPRLQPREDRLDEAMAALGVQVDETFRVFAKRWWRSKQLDLAEKTFVDYSWRLAYLESGSSAATGWARSRLGWSTASAMSSPSRRKRSAWPSSGAGQ